MEISILSAFWLVTSSVLLMAYFIDQHPSAPNVWRSLFRWGKMRIGVVTGSKQFFEVPKKWFQHFYIIGIVANVSLLILLYRMVFMNLMLPLPLTSLLEHLQYPVINTEMTNAVPVLMVLTLEGIQVSRRFYETFCINVFSKAATMTLMHYLLGIVYYLSIGLSVLTGTNFKHLHLPDSVSLTDWIVYAVALLLFISASLLQHQSFKILAALRTSPEKDQSSKTKRSVYHLPRGGLFDMVSCPHFLAEIIIYCSFCVVFCFKNTVVLSLFVFVLVNQVLAALLNHQWYCLNFPSIKSKRYAVFPYLL